MCQGFIKTRGASGGVIVNVSSIEAISAFKRDMVPYIASKAGVLGFTRALAKAYGRKGFRVNALAPGGIKTPGATSIARRVLTEAKRGLVKTGYDFVQRLPLGRFGLPEEVAGVALFLASDLASYVHGAAIPVDGGFLSAWQSRRQYSGRDADSGWFEAERADPRIDTDRSPCEVPSTRTRLPAPCWLCARRQADQPQVCSPRLRPA